jgi:hypothetical protein
MCQIIFAYVLGYSLLRFMDTVSKMEYCSGLGFAVRSWKIR